MHFEKTKQKQIRVRNILNEILQINRLLLGKTSLDNVNVPTLINKILEIIRQLDNFSTFSQSNRSNCFTSFWASQVRKTSNEVESFDKLSGNVKKIIGALGMQEKVKEYRRLRRRSVRHGSEQPNDAKHSRIPNSKATTKGMGTSKYAMLNSGANGKKVLNKELVQMVMPQFEIPLVIHN